jgi:hypothetical protein
MEKFTFLLPCQIVLDAVDIFEKDDGMQYVAFIPYGRATLIMAYTMNDFYLKIYKNDRIPRAFLLFPRESKDFMELLQENTVLKINLVFDYYDFHLSYWNNVMQMSIPIPNVFSPNMSSSDEQMLENIQELFLEVSNGRYNHCNNHTNDSEDLEPYHYKIAVKNWMVGKKFKIYACKKTHGYIFQRFLDEIYGTMSWVWTESESILKPTPKIGGFKDILKRVEIAKCDDVRLDLLVSNHHGIHMPRVFAQNYPDIFKRYAEGEYRHLFFEDGYDLTPDQHQIISEIWDEITQGHYLDEKGEKWQMMIGPDGDLMAYNQMDFDCLPDEEQEKFHDF